MENLCISGANVMGGGEYKDVTMSGACKISSDTKCQSFRASGASKVEGNLICESFNGSGASKVTGKVDCEGLFKCSGATNVGGVAAGDVHVSGAFTSERSVDVKKIAKFSGASKIHGNLTAENVEVTGAITVTGNVNAESFVCEMGASASNCSADSIGGSLVKIMRKEAEFGIFNNVLNVIFNNGNSSVFTVDEIEGDTVDLVGVHARVVRGHDINVGEDCRIKRVEYTGKVTYSGNAEIGELVEI